VGRSDRRQQEAKRRPNAACSTLQTAPARREGDEDAAGPDIFAPVGAAKGLSITSNAPLTTPVPSSTSPEPCRRSLTARDLEHIVGALTSWVCSADDPSVRAVVAPGRGRASCNTYHTGRQDVTPDATRAKG